MKFPANCQRNVVRLAAVRSFVDRDDGQRKEDKVIPFTTVWFGPAMAGCGGYGARELPSLATLVNNAGPGAIKPWE